MGISKSAPLRTGVGGHEISKENPAPPPVDPAQHAARHFEEWISQDNSAALTEHYPFLTLSSPRKRVLDWAGGNLRPFLAIGIEDQDAPVRHHVNKCWIRFPWTC